MKDLHSMSVKSRESFYQISVSPSEKRNRALLLLAHLLEDKRDQIFQANNEDTDRAKDNHLPSPLLHRLTFNQDKLHQVIQSLTSLSEMPDPLNKTLYSMEIADHLELYRVSSPIGVIGVIFESRPDALIQISSLCIKSGNSVLLKGGSEAQCTNQILCDIVRESLDRSSLPADAAQLLETREDVNNMIKEDTLIDLIIPRGSNQFVRYIMDNSRIPVLGHSDGLCHVYIDEDADIELACKIAVDSKAQNVSVCNAMETLLVHRGVASSFLSAVYPKFLSRNVLIRGDENVRKIITCDPANDIDWSTEYLDYILSIKIVSSMEEAVAHINRYGSHHTDCIVSSNKQHALEFMKKIDSAGVYWNASTRFADGYVYGLGAEVGISTGKLHARGPMGLEGLTTYKYLLFGSGQTMEEVKNGKISYSHKLMDEQCPL